MSVRDAVPAPGAAACAAIVARDDPHLHATALFAPEPARAGLMVLYAFDIELSRAALVSTESLIPRMRLQWWRDTVEAARAGAPAPAHEVAGPLAALARDLPVAPLEAMIAAREAELAGGLDAAGFETWCDDRFGALTEVAARLLTAGDAPGDVAGAAIARRAGPVLGTAFALRHAPAMAARGGGLLPGLAPADRAALADGTLTPAAGAVVRRLADEALAALAALRAARDSIDRRATPALLPLLRAERVLRRARRAAGQDGEAMQMGSLGDGGRPFEGLAMAWATATGRW